MDEVQLKVGLARARAMADAIERDVGANPDHPDRGELTHTLHWLRHRISLREAAIERAKTEE